MGKPYAGVRRRSRLQREALIAGRSRRLRQGLGFASSLASAWPRRHSSGVRRPFVRLQRWQAATRLAGVVGPPRALGAT